MDIKPVWIAKDGKKIYGEVKIVAGYDRNGEFLESKGVFRNFTERKNAKDEKVKLEKQLQNAQKMESIGTLAGGIAHDFNNILGIILGNTELAMSDIPEWNPTRHHLEEVKTASLRARDVVMQLLSFSRKTELELKPQKIIPIIKESLNLLRSSIPTSIEIRQNIIAQPDIILADPTQIHQILINLCTNAAHAMKKTGGVLEITLKNVKLDNQSVRHYDSLAPGKYLKLTVSDTGLGIDPAIRDKIFDPYFTTKGIGRGTGLGLSVVYGIVKNYGGDIKAHSEKGKGTIFDIYLPLVQPNIKITKTTSPELMPKGAGHVLIVDDEEMIIQMLKKMVEHIGYRVTAYNCSKEALKAFHSCPEKFDLVLTDMTMPNISGIQLAKKILEIQKNTPIILCTGYNDQGIESKAKALGISEYILKPVIMSELAKAINRALNKEFIEQRKHKRFEMIEGIYAVPVSDASIQYQIIDISEGGLSFCYKDKETLSKGFSELSIKMEDDSYILNNIPFKFISDKKITKVFSLNHEKMKQTGIQFGVLTPFQTDQLKSVVQNYTVSNAFK